MNYLFIAEKPSLMREVKQCYDKHQSEVKSVVGTIHFKAMSGHLCCNYEPDDYEDWSGEKWGDVDYPMIPARWGIKAINTPHAKKLISEIRKAAG